MIRLNRSDLAVRLRIAEDSQVAAAQSALCELLDDDPSSFTIADWRHRNEALYQLLAKRGIIDSDTVSFHAHRYLNKHLIHHRVGAATDTQNAGHVRAQNENIVHYALAMRAPAPAVAVSLQAGFIHDLNKAFGEPLRGDRFAPCDQRGRPLRSMTTMAQIVGLNHLGDRTRRLLQRATELDRAPLQPEVAEQIDHCIIHHGLGSSQFIRNLVDGKNPWWGQEFVDPVSGVRRLLHPDPPPMTVSTVLHDLADSTQQMQGGAAWLMKYPAGYWRAAGRSYASMLSARIDAEDQGIQLSLAKQIEEETHTCRGIIEEARTGGLLDDQQRDALHGAIDEAAQPSIDWVCDEPGELEESDGVSAYHDVGRALGVTAIEAQERLRTTIPGTPEGDRIEEALWASGRRLDLRRAEALAKAIEAA